jgi:1-acyl-sn-glycerol-3-phosphate acyltransferase
VEFSLKLLPRIALTALVLAIWTPIITVLIAISRIFVPDRGPAYRLARQWTRAVAACMGLTFSIEGTEKIAPDTSYIITPNHQGNADILALYGELPLRFRWVVKKSLIRIPFFGWALHCTGAISIDRSDREGSIKKLQEGTSKLSGGWSLLIYPEGTRGTDPHLQPFKKGAFMMAVQTGIPLLPVVCNGAYRVLPKKTVTFKTGGHITVAIGNPIETKGLTVEDVPALMERTRIEMLKLLDPDYDPYGGRPPRLPAGEGV